MDPNLLQALESLKADRWKWSLTNAYGLYKCMVWRDNLRASTVSTTMRQTQQVVSALEDTLDNAARKVLERVEKGLYDQTPGEPPKPAEGQEKPREGHGAGITTRQALQMRRTQGILPPGAEYADPRVRDIAEEFVLAFSAIKSADRKLEALAHGTI